MAQKSITDKKKPHAEPPPPAVTPAPVAEKALVANGPAVVATAADAPPNPFGKYAGRGMETVDTALIKVPFLLLVSSQSEGVAKKGDVLFGQVGNFYHPLTGEIFDGERGFVGVAISINKTYIERTPNPARKFVAKHSPDSEFVRASIARTERENREKPDTHGFGKLIAPEGPNQVIETHEVLMNLAPVMEDGEPDMGASFPSVVPFKSSGIPFLSKWLSGVSMNRALPDGTKVPAGAIPLFGNEFKMVATPMERDRNSWHVPNPTPRHGSVRASVAQGILYTEACNLIEQMARGEASIDEESEHAVQETGEIAPAPARKMNF